MKSKQRILFGCYAMVLAILPAIFMMFGIAELVSERVAKLDRRLPKVRLQREFGALVLGDLLCFIFFELIYKTYK